MAALTRREFVSAVSTGIAFGKLLKPEELANAAPLSSRVTLRWVGYAAALATPRAGELLGRVNSRGFLGYPAETLLMHRITTGSIGEPVYREVELIYCECDKLSRVGRPTWNHWWNDKKQAWEHMTFHMQKHGADAWTLVKQPMYASEDFSTQLPAGWRIVT